MESPGQHGLSRSGMAEAPTYHMEARPVAKGRERHGRDPALMRRIFPYHVLWSTRELFWVVDIFNTKDPLFTYAAALRRRRPQWPRRQLPPTAAASLQLSEEGFACREVRIAPTSEAQPLVVAGHADDVRHRASILMLPSASPRSPHKGKGGSRLWSPAE